MTLPFENDNMKITKKFPITFIYKKSFRIFLQHLTVTIYSSNKERK